MLNDDVTGTEVLNILDTSTTTFTTSTFNIFKGSGAVKLEFGQTNGNWKIEAGNSGNNTLIIGSVSNATNNITLDTTNGGSATFSGNITFGDSHFIGDDSDDNLLIQSSASENIILDSADDIILDADGGDIKFKDGGTEIGALDLAGGFAIKSSVSDADFFIQGNDGGSIINALQIDMSAGGDATFDAGGNGGDGGSPNEAADAGENGSGGEGSGGGGGAAGGDGAAIRRTNNSIQVNISDPTNALNGRGSTTATTVQ